ncbi:MAG: UDP-N-acetylglucosamine 2-epimerase (non-hydrolyzing) [Anaerolineae bacterium]|nr:UDP-N-acetylglucosamine 2-epimerase (non-hydrolyzing) [Anaerolineae bacterium]
MKKTRIKVLSVVGTRPEAIKMAPVIRALRRRPGRVDCRVCVTAQHRRLLDQVLHLFGIAPDYDLDVMAEDQSPTQVAAAVLARLEPILRAERPDWVLVQGDTTTVLAASIAAFYARARVAHVEAGLRTHDRWQPFPEEMNRRVASVVADLHLAPTDWARDNLLREGVPGECIRVTGNPVIDALQWAASLPYDPAGGPLGAIPRDGRLLLVTAHRRENFGRPLEEICRALVDLVAAEGDLHVVYPVHPNPTVQGTVTRLLAGQSGVTLTPPLSYLALVNLLKRACLVLTDSGGIQEEAPGLGKPVLVLREVTERPEAVAAGTVQVVGTDRGRIVAAARRLLDDPAAYAAMARAVNPYGDGQAAERIAAALLGEAVEPWRAPAYQGLPGIRVPA